MDMCTLSATKSPGIIKTGILLKKCAEFYCEPSQVELSTKFLHRVLNPYIKLSGFSKLKI